MKLRHILLSLAVLPGLVGLEPAMAQPAPGASTRDGPRPASGRPRLGDRNGSQRPSRPDRRPAPPPVSPPQVSPPQVSPPQSGRPGARPDRPGGRPDRPGARPDRPGVRPDRPGARPGRPSRPRPPAYHRPGAGRPPVRPIHAPPFRYPHGYRYRRWSLGVLLPSILLSSAYVYHQYAGLGLGAPPQGHEWVRYGPDLLLVDRRTRRVDDVVYGAFR